MQSVGNALKNGEPPVGFYFTTMLQQKNMSTLENQIRSSDVAAADFYLFLPLKLALK
jgi:hypothetical protein